MPQSLSKETKNLLDKYKIQINPSLDQHFLIDESVVKSIQKALDMKQQDVLLEIGSGLGNITKELITNKAIIVEIDKQLHIILQEQLKDKQFTLIKKSAYKYFQDQLKLQKEEPQKIHTEQLNTKQLEKLNKKFNKIYSNIPFTAAESIFTLLPKINFEISVFVIPEDFFNDVISNIIYEAFFNIEIIQKLDADMFYPVPDAKLMLIKITKIKECKDYADFIIRELYLQNDKKLKNALRETLITFFEKYLNKKSTKNDVKQIITLLSIDRKLLETDVNQISLERLKIVIESLIEHIKGNYGLHLVKSKKLNQ